MATFLDRKLHGNYQGEIGNRFNIRIEGTRIKHTLGAVSLKLYDKFGLMLRIKTDAACRPPRRCIDSPAFPPAIRDSSRPG